MVHKLRGFRLLELAMILVKSWKLESRVGLISWALFRGGVAKLIKAALWLGAPVTHSSWTQDSAGFPCRPARDQSETQNYQGFHAAAHEKILEDLKGHSELDEWWFPDHTGNFYLRTAARDGGRPSHFRKLTSSSATLDNSSTALRSERFFLLLFFYNEQALLTCIC